MMMNATNDLRQLYRSAKRMAASDDVEVLLECLLEDLVNSTEFERILLLKLNHSNFSLVVEKYHGFKNTPSVPHSLPFLADTGLLHQVYSDREPLHLVQSINEHTSTTIPPSDSHDDNQSVNSGNRRQPITLCIPADDALHTAISRNKKYHHYSMRQFDYHDKNLSSLLGNITSFLILPICDQDNFYGFMIGDKSKSAKAIFYDEIRQSCALANHSANALCRAREHKQMLTKIANQLTEIEQLESFSQSIVQNLRSGLIILNQLMNITEINKAAELTLGYSEEELLGKPIDYLLEDRHNGQKCLFTDESDELDSRMGLLAETPMHKKNGQTFPAEICYSVITNQDDEIQGLSCIFRDITARKDMERNLARIDKLSSLGELAAGIAHEIKNPLAGIAGAIQIISKSYEEECQHRYIFNEVLSQVNRLDSFVNELLKFARPGQTHSSTVDLEAIMGKALFVAASQLNNKDITITRNFRKNSPSIQGDADQLEQVFLNILLNAIDAIATKGKIVIETFWEFHSDPPSTPGSRCSTPGCETAAGQFTIAITDNGKGIDSVYLETIFNPFHTTKSNGTGLGLSISQRIIEQHSGSISVKSTPSQGATFSVHLPICAANKISRSPSLIL
jgi:PAS domain S-box-containing protein